MKKTYNTPVFIYLPINELSEYFAAVMEQIRQITQAYMDWYKDILDKFIK